MILQTVDLSLMIDGLFVKVLKKTTKGTTTPLISKLLNNSQIFSYPFPATQTYLIN